MNRRADSAISKTPAVWRTFTFVAGSTPPMNWEDPLSAAVVCGVGGYVPSLVVTNADLTMRFSTSEEWISSRTGIRQRHVVTDGESTSDLAVQAGEAALKSAGVDS